MGCCIVSEQNSDHMRTSQVHNPTQNTSAAKWFQSNVHNMAQVKMRNYTINVILKLRTCVIIGNSRREDNHPKNNLKLVSYFALASLYMNLSSHKKAADVNGP